MLQHLEPGDGLAELFALLGVVQGLLHHLRHGAHGVRARRGNPMGQGSINGRTGVLPIAEHLTSPHLHIGQRDVGGATAVHSEIGPNVQPRLFSGNEKHTCSPLRQFRGEEYGGRHGRGGHRFLRACQHIAVAIRFGCGLVTSVIVRKGQPRLTRNNSRQMISAAAKLHQLAAKNNRRNIGLQHQSSAERLHKGGDFRAAHAEPTQFFGEWQAKPSHLGKARPNVLAPAGFAGDQSAKYIVRIMLAEKLLRALTDQALIFGGFKIHWVRTSTDDDLPAVDTNRVSTAYRP